MSKEMFRSCIYFILYCVLLVVAIVKIDAILSFVSAVLVLLIPLGIGAIIAMVLNRPNKFLYRSYCRLLTRGKESVICKILGIVSVYMIFFAVIITVFSFIIPQFINSFKAIYDNLGSYYNNIMNFWEDIQKTFNFKLDAAALSDEFLKIFQNATEYITEYSSKVFQITTSIFSAITNTLFGMIFSVYLLIDKNRLKFQAKSMMQAYFSDKIAFNTIKIGRMSADIFQSYIGVRLMEAAVTGLLCFFGMSVFGFKYPVFISAVVGLSSIIPVFGALLGGAAAIIINVIVEPDKILWFLLFFVVLKLLEGTLIFPKVIKNRTMLPGVWAFFSVIFLGMAFGILGMLVSVPVAAILYNLLQDAVHRRNIKKGYYRTNSELLPETADSSSGNNSSEDKELINH